jgi:hypothetical protein
MWPGVQRFYGNIAYFTLACPSFWPSGQQMKAQQ